MKHWIPVVFLLVGLFLVSNDVYAVPDSAEWGYTGEGKTWVDDPTQISKASGMNQGNNVSMWIKYVVGVSVVVGLIIWFRKQNS